MIKHFLSGTLGILMGIALSPVLSQVVESPDIPSIPLVSYETLADKKYATSTEADFLIKENYNNTQEITKRLDKIIKLLQKRI